MKKKLLLFLLLLVLFPISKVKAINVSYKTHIQNVGWQNYVSNNELSGTTGRALRLEGIYINISDSEYSGDIEYSTHIQNIGWQKFVKNNELSGTTGRALRLEGIKIRLTGELAEHYSVLYSVHVQNVGWMPYVKDGELSGTTGRALRLEGIKIKLVSKDSYDVKLSYASLNNNGWQDYVDSGISGSEGTGLGINKVKIRLTNNSALSGNIKYQTYTFFKDWQNEVTSDQESGASDEKIEAIKIYLTDELANTFDIYYRVYVIDQGWMGWTSNGAEAGTKGYFKAIDGIEIKMVNKGDTTIQNQAGSYKESVDSISYSSHVSNIGWMKYVSNNELSGTTGENRRLEAFKIKVSSLLSGDVVYKSYISRRGWSSEVKNDELSGTTGLARNMEAISIRLTGDIAKYYSVYYRTHMSFKGWTGWAKDGEESGCLNTDNSKVEAIQIMLVKKGTNPGVDTNNRLYTGMWKNNNTNYYDALGNLSKGFKLIDGVKYYFNPEGKLYGKNVQKIIDVSSWQEVIDWNTIKKNDDVDAAIIRVGWGTSYNDACGLDSYFDRNIKEVQRLGIPYGIYIYAYAETTAAAQKEADFVISKMKQYNMPSGTYVWYDAEISSISRSIYNTVIPAFVNRIKSAGYNNVGVYSGVRQLDTTNGNTNTPTIRSYPIWVSQYYKDLQYTGTYKGWQFASDEHVDGINGNVDVSMFKK